MSRFVRASMLTLLVLAPSAAAAQEERPLGLSMGYPSSVALLWHTTDRIAIRPELTFSTVSSDTDTTDLDGHAYTAGVSLLFYTMQRDALSTYVAPAYLFGRSSNESSSGFETTGRVHQVNGSFGVQYRLGERVRVFGETGLSLSKTTNEIDDIFESESSVTRFGTRGAVGVVFYF